MDKKSCSIFFITCFFLGVFAQESFSAKTTYLQPDINFLPDEITGNYSVVLKNTVAFLNRQLSPATGLIESYRGTSPYYYMTDQEIFYRDKEGYLDNQCFTYDLATSVIIYTICGKTVGCVASTVWRSFSLLDFNPLQINIGDSAKDKATAEIVQSKIKVIEGNI